MGNPAARRGDPTSHTSTLRGIGWVSVKIGGKASWRAYDVHGCNMQNTTPPPASAPVPHATGSVLKGSLSVLIGNQPAARQGDVVIEPACVPPTVPFPPNNPITVGFLTVQIGDVAFGMTDPLTLEEFCNGWAQLMADWAGLTPAQREQRMRELVNNALQRSGTPPISQITANAPAGANGAYDFTSHTIQVGSGMFGATPPSARVAGTLVHEARHAQQWYNAARYLASGNRGAGAIHSATGINPAVCQSAAANPAGLNTVAGQHGRMLHNSYYGPHSGYNAQIRGINQAGGDPGNRLYYGLPEERDAEEVTEALNGSCAAAHDSSWSPSW